MVASSGLAARPDSHGSDVPVRHVTRAVEACEPRELPEERALTRAEFAALYRRNFAYVWRSARHLGVRPAEIDDVVQETFVTAHRLFATYEARGKEQEWLFSILYRIFQHHRSWTSRRAALTDDDANLETLPASPASGPERDLENNEAVRTLEEILDRLDPEKRAVLVLAEIEERSLGEIAKILDLNANTVASRLRLARERVRAEVARLSARDGWRYK